MIMIMIDPVKGLRRVLLSVLLMLPAILFITVVSAAVTLQTNDSDIEDLRQLTTGGQADMLYDGNTKYYVGADNPMWDVIKDDLVSAGLQWNGVQCTSFTRWRFYKYYGYSYGTLGNGREVAANLARQYSSAFTLETDISKVKAGSVFSKKTGRSMCLITIGNHKERLFCGHVGFIEKIENGRVYYSDGNITLGSIKHSIRFNESKTLEEWIEWVGDGAMYAVPI